MSAVRYKIVRYYLNNRWKRRAVKTGLTLQEAHCANPESSSGTFTSAAGRRRTRERGIWFDGYTAM